MIYLAEGHGPISRMQQILTWNKK